jgi:hypothetical protein
LDRSRQLVTDTMVLCCVLLQLFAPEIFRLLRRRPELFGHWMRAYLVQEDGYERVFTWQKSGADQWMTWLEHPTHQVPHSGAGRN